VTRPITIPDSPAPQSLDEVAAAFVNARLAAGALESYPGLLPDSLTSAYRCQAHAIELWPDDVAGWKVGSIRRDLAQSLGQNRLIGPIFARSVRRAAPGERLEFRTFAGGFAAAEPEYVLQIGRDAEPARTNWTVEEAKALVSQVFQGVEIAGSPLSAINDLGPAVVVSDFGNNDGLILGEAIDDWPERPLAEWSSRLYLDDVLIGSGSVTNLVGGPFESLRFALEQTAKMGRPLREGALISTGAITGVHRLHAGQRVRAVFATGGEILCLAL
jgi:2-keto-4-pentenoate hydratase